MLSLIAAIFAAHSVGMGRLVVRAFADAKHSRKAATETAAHSQSLVGGCLIPRDRLCRQFGVRTISWGSRTGQLL